MLSSITFHRTMKLFANHNAGVVLHENITWKDFQVNYFSDDHSDTLIQYETDEFNAKSPRNRYDLSKQFSGPEYADWMRITLNGSKKTKRTTAAAIKQIQFLENFTEQQFLQPNFTKGFIWEIYPVWYEYGAGVTKYFDEKRKSAPTLEERNRVPSFDVHHGCQYTERGKALADQLAERVFDYAHELYPYSNHLGMFHIRRGDLQAQCNTSLPEISSYLSCSLKDINVYGNVTVMLASLGTP